MRAHRALAAIGVLLAAGCSSSPVGKAAVDPATAGAARSSPSTVPPSASSPSTATGETGSDPVQPARRARTAPAAERPVRIVLPSGRPVPVAAVGTTPRGLLDVPADVDVAGWWRGGARLGDPFGSILVAAHVDSRTQGLGPFAELLDVAPGARVDLRSGGLRQRFRVRSRQLVPQGSLADDSWIFDVAGASRLTLVTCAPPYVAARGGYQNLAVLTADPVGTPERT